MLYHCITTGILYYAIEDTVTNTSNVTYAQTVHDGKVGCNTGKYTTAFPYSGGLNFLWHSARVSGSIHTLRLSSQLFAVSY